MQRLKCAALIVWVTGVLPAFSQTRQIVLLYDERIDLPGLAMLDAGFVRAFSGSPDHVEIYREAMDLSRFDSDAYRNLLRDHLRAKYAVKKIDVAVAAMEPALDFLLSHREEVFPGTPIVFCGIDRKRLGAHPLPSDVTGVLLKREFSPTLELALSLHPETERIVVVAGTSEFDARLLEQAREEFRPFENRLAFTYLTTLPLTKLLSQLSRLPPKTIVLYSTVFRDGAGNAFVPHEVAARVSAAANAPVYGIHDQFLGRGIVGGRLYGLGPHGEAAAGLVVKILKGTKPSELPPIEPLDSVTAFDWRQLQRWGIDDSRLPSGAIIQFRPTSLWSEYKYYVIGGLVIIMAQTVTIAALVVHRARRRRAERSLTESENRFRLAADAAPVMIWMTGTDKLYTFLNKLWLEFTGRKIEQELGAGWADSVHPDDVQQCLKTYAESFDARKPFVMEYRLRRHDGEYRWISDTGGPRYDARGEFNGYIGSCVDVSEARHKTEALRESESRLRAILDTAVEGIITISERGLIESVNAATEKIFGYSAAEMIGHNVSMLMPFREEHDSHLGNYLPAHEPKIKGIGRDVRGRRKDGSVFPMELAVSEIRLADRRVFTGFVRDIAERKRLEEESRHRAMELAHVTRVSTLGELSGSLAHELNQPLTAILSNAQAAQRFLAGGTADLDEVRDILKDIVDEDRRAGEIIQRMRAMLKKGEVKFQPLDLNGTIQEVLTIMRSDLVTRHVTIAVQLSPRLPLVHGDRIQIQQVLINLIVNSCDAMARHDASEARVTIETDRDGGGHALVSVSDCGPGIPADAAEKIFEPFYSTKEHGIGMGLAICRSIIASHGGRLWAANNNGSGALFHFTVPIHKEAKP